MLQTARIIWVNGEQAICLPRDAWRETDTVCVERRGGSLLVLPPSAAPGTRPHGPQGAAPVAETSGGAVSRWGALSLAERRAEILSLFGGLPANDDPATSA